jgi:hypothetical protein
MFHLIFIAVLGGVPQSPVFLGDYVSSDACVSMAKRVAKAGGYSQWAFVCDDGTG